MGLSYPCLSLFAFMLRLHGLDVPCYASNENDENPAYPTVYFYLPYDDRRCIFIFSTLLRF